MCLPRVGPGARAGTLPAPPPTLRAPRARLRLAGQGNWPSQAGALHLAHCGGRMAPSTRIHVQAWVHTLVLFSISTHSAPPPVSPWQPNGARTTAITMRGCPPLDSRRLQVQLSRAQRGSPEEEGI